MFSIHYRETFRIINGYMSKNNLNFELKSRVRRYLEFKMENEKNLDSESCEHILNKLTKKMKDEVLLESFEKYIQNIPFFNDNFSKSTLEKLSLSLKELSFSPKEIIFQVNIYFFNFY